MHSKTKWILAGIVFALLAIVFLGLFALHYRVPEEQAIAAGARVEINLKTGEVKQADAKKPEEEKKPEEKVEEKPAENVEHKEAEAKPEEEHTEKLPPAAAEEEKKVMPAEVKKTEAEPVAAAPAPVAETPKGPRVAIIIVGVGLSRSSTEQIMALPAPVSFSFSPYASEVAQWVKKAQEGKHEVYLDLPLEPKDYPYTDPGPYALLTGLDDEKNKERLNSILKSGVDYQGLVAGPEERFTETPRSQEWLFNAIKAKKLTFAFLARPSNHQFMQEAEKNGLNTFGIDKILDEKLTTEAIDTALSGVESLAEKSGFAVALARPYPISVQRIEAWMKTLADKGITVVPLSQLKPMEKMEEKPVEKKNEAGDLKHDSH